MAEENQKKGEKEEAPKKSFKLNVKPAYVIVAGLVLMSFMTFVTGYFATHKTEKAIEKPKEAPAAAEDNLKLGTLFPLDPFIVNLIDYNGRRYLKTTIELEIEEEPGQEKKEKKEEGKGKGGNSELDKMVPYMRNIIINILSSKTFKDISSVEGKDALRQEIAFRINSAMTKGKIKNVYFKEFVVQ